MADPEDTSRFLTLPREVRDQVYGYLLSIKQIDRVPAEPVGEWCTYSGPRSPLTVSLWPRHDVELYPNILRANREINYEAGLILYDMNLLINIRGWGVGVADVASLVGVAILFEDSKARCLKRCAISINIFPRMWPKQFTGKEREASSQCVIACEDLRAFCQGLVIAKTYQKLRLALSSLAIDVTLESDLIQSGLNKVSHKSAVHKLLSPFAELYGIHQLSIDGIQDTSFCEKIALQAKRPVPTTRELLDATRLLMDEGNDAFCNGNFCLAVSTYQNAYKNCLKLCRLSGNADVDFWDLIFSRISRNLSAVYLKLSQWGQAQIWISETLEQRHFRFAAASLAPDESLDHTKLVFRRALALMQANMIVEAAGTLIEFEQNWIWKAAFDEELFLLDDYLSGGTFTPGNPDTSSGRTDFFLKWMSRSKDQGELEKVLQAITI